MNAKVSNFIAEIYKEPSDPVAKHQLVPLSNGGCNTTREEHREVRSQISCGKEELQLSASNYLRNKEFDFQIHEIFVNRGEITVKTFSDTTLQTTISPTMHLRCSTIWPMEAANGQLKNIWALLKGAASRVSHGGSTMILAEPRKGEKMNVLIIKMSGSQKGQYSQIIVVGMFLDVGGNGNVPPEAFLSVDPNSHNLDILPARTGKEKVSGLDSFADSSKTSRGTEVESGDYVSMHDRLRMANISARGRNMDQEDLAGAATQVDKQKQNNAILNPERGSLMEEMDEHNKASVANAAHDTFAATHGVSPAKSYKTSSVRRTHLTGAHGEPRQEK